MTPQERDMLSGLISKVQQMRLTEKDPEADQLLEQGLGNDRDAVYVLAQTVLVQNLALNQARAQIQQLQQQAQSAQQAQPAKATSFLGSLLHLGGSEQPQQPVSPAQQQQFRPQAPPPYQPVSQYAPPQPGYVPQAYGVPMQSGGAGSFMRSAATTAAGVAAGALAFEGIESLFHHGGGGAGFGGFGSGGGGEFLGGTAPREEIVNNYYGDVGGNQAENRGFDDSNYTAGNDQGLDSSDAGLQDASYDSSSAGGDLAQDDSSFSSSGDDFSSDFGGNSGDDSSLI